jgi:hypothetical protein
MRATYTESGHGPAKKSGGMAIAHEIESTVRLKSPPVFYTFWDVNLVPCNMIKGYSD